MVSPEISVPIRTDKHGVIRIADTRVSLDVVIARFQQGRTPEQIQESFPTLKLADIYAVITYYLNNQPEVDAYLLQQDEEADQVRRDVETKRPDMFTLQRALPKRLPKRD